MEATTEKNSNDERWSWDHAKPDPLVVESLSLLAAMPDESSDEIVIPLAGMLPQEFKRFAEHVLRVVKPGGVIRFGEMPAKKPPIIEKLPPTIHDLPDEQIRQAIVAELTRRGMSVKELGTLTGTIPQSLSRYLAGRGAKTLRTIDRIIEVLRLDVKETANGLQIVGPVIAA